MTKMNLAKRRLSQKGHRWIGPVKVCVHCGLIQHRAPKSKTSGKRALKMSQEEMMKRLGALHDRHVEREAPEISFMRAMIERNIPEGPALHEFLGYIASNVTIGQIRQWLLRDKAPLRLASAYIEHEPKSDDSREEAVE